MLELFTLFAGIVLAQLSPGPNLMAVSAASLGSGRGAGLLTAAGVAAGVFLWAILFATGIGALLEAFPQTITAMRILGGLYLLYLGVKALRAALSKPPEGAMSGPAALGSLASFRRGFIIVMTNPKAALMWVAISMFLASSGLSMAQFLVVGMAASASAMMIYGGYALLFSTGVAHRAYRRSSRAIEALFGAAFGAIGAKLLMDGVRDIRT